MLLRIVILSLCFILGVQSQENAGSSVAKSLIECYNKTENLDRERRPASSINVLIDLIRKIESGLSKQDIRQFSKEIVHRFKQDGIITYVRSENNPYTVPYTPKGIQSDKHRIYLRKLVPGNAVNFPNETLNEIERCSLHFMLSNSFDVRKRNDEDYVCKKLDRYQRRIRRDLSNPNDDVEIFHPSKSSPSKGNLQDNELDEKEPETADEQVETNVLQEPRAAADQKHTIYLSECPVENGAVYSRWGTIQAGIVIAGIAAGLEPQNIQTDEGYVVDNRYAATLAGDLSEVALHQGTGGKQTFDVGANGGWNGTQVPRWYFIQAKSELQMSQMTDAEIRGGLDGLIISKNIKEWQSKADSIKISQILDMYYSPRGVFSKKFRACNRQKLFTEVAPQNELTDQTIAFSFLLDDEAKLSGTTSADGIKAYTEKAVNSLLNYIPSLQDLSCEVEQDTIVRASTDILIVLDTAWSFKVVHPALAYLLDNLDINKYDSSFTIINGKDGGVIVNSTNTILDFYAQYNRSVHFEDHGGFNVATVFNAIEVITKRKMDADKINKKAGGQSTVVLFVPYNTLSSSDISTANDRKQYLRTSLPDLKLLVLGRNANGYGSLVLDSVADAFSLSDTSTDGAAITGSVNPVIDRVKEIPRRLVNHECGSSWSGSSSSPTLDQYIEPNSTNYYRVSPHYFFGEGTRGVKFSISGYGTLSVCTSRQKEKPGSTDECQTVTSSTPASFSLTDGCNNYDEVNQCPAAYFSVAAAVSGTSTNNRCDDCRFPDSIKFKVELTNFGCSSGTYRIMANIAVLITTFLTIKLVF